MNKCSQIESKDCIAVVGEAKQIVSSPATFDNSQIFINQRLMISEVETVGLV